MLYKEAVYLVLDELKVVSDDSLFTEDHIIFLLDKYRNFILKQRYADIKKPIPESNYQTICLDLIQVEAIEDDPCGGVYLRSKEKIPYQLPIGKTSVYGVDFYQGDISFVTRDRMRNVGFNRYTQNMIYSSIGPDRYLYLKSKNPQFLYLEKVKMTGIFEDAKAAAELSCCKECQDDCDILEQPFPLEDALFPQIAELIVKELSGAVYRVEDEKNNSNDDLHNNAENRVQKMNQHE